MEAIQFIADNPDISTSPLLSIAPLLAAALPGAISGAVSGLAGIAQGIFGGRKRREEQRAAAAELRNRTSQYENFQFQNFYAGLENPYEDLTVNTQAADFAAQQQQQGLANTLDTLRQSGGGLGAAALAQSLASIQSQNLQQASASIAQQEAANARMAAQGEMSLQMAEAGGAANVQAQEFDRNETLIFEGYIGQLPSTVSMSGGKMNIKIYERRNQTLGNYVNLGLAIGKGKNEVESLPEKYTPEDLHVFADDKTQLGIGDKIRITATDIYTSTGYYSLEGYKIEKIEDEKLECFPKKREMEQKMREVSLWTIDW
jgi:hypothetical protein